MDDTYLSNVAARRRGNISSYATINALSFQPFKYAATPATVGLKSMAKIVTSSLYYVCDQVQESLVNALLLFFEDFNPLVTTAIKGFVIIYTMFTFSLNERNLEIYSV